MRQLLLVSTLLFVVCAKAPSLDYQSLLAAVVAADPVLATLEIAQRQAEVAVKRAVAGRDRLGVVIQTGEGRMEYSPTSTPAGARFSAHPEASLGLPRGPTGSLALPFSTNPGGSVITPNLSLSVPLLTGPYLEEVTVQQQELALVLARSSAENRALQVEKSLVDRLISLFRASTVVGEANRKLLKAKVELSRAVRLDGAVVGGKAYLDGERAVRMATREVHRAEAESRQQLSELALLSGLAESPQLIPNEFPDSDLSASLPEATALPLVQQAQGRFRFASFRAEETAKEATAALRLGGGYGFETGYPTPPSTGLEMTSGLSFSSEEWTTSLDLGWNQTTGQRLQISFAWKPLAPGEAELKRQGSSLEVQAEGQAVNQALVEGVRSLKSLELRRAQLVIADQNLAEDLRWATAQLARYREWYNTALVTQNELDEVEATVQALQTEVTLQKLDRLAWALDRKSLLGEARDKP